MAKYETTVRGNIRSIVEKVEAEITGGSISASLEDSSDFNIDGVKCSVRVFERYSWTGSNRVSLSVTFLQGSSDKIYVSAITSGGSQALFFKVNTFGEEAFLDKIKAILQ